MDERLPLTSQPVVFHCHGTFVPNEGWRAAFWSAMAHELPGDARAVEVERMTTAELLTFIELIAWGKLGIV